MLNEKSFIPHNQDTNTEKSLHDNERRWFPDKSFEQFASARARLLQDEMLTADEKLEQISDMDSVRAHEIATDTEEYNKYDSDQTTTQMADALRAAKARNLLSELQDPGGHYDLPPNSCFIVNYKKAEGFAERQILFKDKYVVDEGVFFVSCTVIDKEPSNKFGDYEEQLHGGILVDTSNNDVRVVVLPDVLVSSDPEKIVRPKSELATERDQVLEAYTELIKVPEYEHRAFTRERSEREINNDQESDRVTLLQESVTSTLLFRRRTLVSGMESGKIYEEITDLLDSIPGNDIPKYHEAGGGTFQLEVYLAADDNNVVYEKPIVIDASDLPTASSEISRFLESGESGYRKAVVVPRGSYVPRELENKPKGPSPRAHTRRIRTKTVVVLPHHLDTPEIRGIKQKVQIGENLTTEELMRFSQQTSMTPEQIQAVIKENQKLLSREITGPDAEPVRDFADSDKDDIHFYKKAS